MQPQEPRSVLSGQAGWAVVPGAPAAAESRTLCSSGAEKGEDGEGWKERVPAPFPARMSRGDRQCQPCRVPVLPSETPGIWAGASLDLDLPICQRGTTFSSNPGSSNLRPPCLPEGCRLDQGVSPRQGWQGRRVALLQALSVRVELGRGQGPS